MKMKLNLQEHMQQHLLQSHVLQEQNLSKISELKLLEIYDCDCNINYQTYLNSIITYISSFVIIFFFWNGVNDLISFSFLKIINKN